MKYKVGQKVRITKNYHQLLMGDVLSIKRVDEDDSKQPVQVVLPDGLAYWPYTDRFELIDESSEKATDEGKPREFQVGDIIVGNEKAERYSWTRAGVTCEVTTTVPERYPNTDIEVKIIDESYTGGCSSFLVKAECFDFKTSPIPAPSKQSTQELIEENQSLEKQINKLRAQAKGLEERIEKKMGFYSQNAAVVKERTGPAFSLLEVTE